MGIAGRQGSKGDLAGALADLNKALELKPDWAKAREKRDAVARK